MVHSNVGTKSRSISKEIVGDKIERHEIFGVSLEGKLIEYSQGTIAVRGVHMVLRGRNGREGAKLGQRKNSGGQMRGASSALIQLHPSEREYNAQG